MIFLNLKLNNVYMFKDTFIDFTYPKKTTNSTIEYEYLQEFPNIKFKRVNIIMGANASGKTSLGKVMRDIVNYLYGRNIEHLSKIIYQKNNKATIEFVYVLSDKKTINRVVFSFNENNILQESFFSLELKKTWSLKSALEKISTVEAVFKYDINKFNRGITNPGLKSVAVSTGVELISDTQWYFQFSDGGDYSQNFKYQDINLLEKILKTFDASIKSVKSIDRNTYQIKFENKDTVIIKNGRILDKHRLSRGTQEAIEVASFLSAILNLDDYMSGIFYLDEKMAYSHSEIEVALVNLLIEKLNSYSQFFYTTHNYDILEMNLPTHSFLFLKRDADTIKAIHPEKLNYTKNDRSLLNYIKNDVFGTLPDTYLIDELL